MKNFINKNRYEFNKNLGIWIANNHKGISYSDGDAVEQRIKQILTSANDISILSTELKKHCSDWPSLYHLSSKRANLLRPFQHLLHSANVLEVGAGCGALTRYLGESGANVIALEGTPRRAEITRERTRDLENVEVICDIFESFDCEEKFDFITLVGVFEYASVYSSNKEPHIKMLEHARQLLKPDGHLIVAIENQLGLKYFAGAPEDHLGEIMYGIEGRYISGQPKTFGRQVIYDMFEITGYNHIEQFVPYPDYKLPSSIITTRAFTANGFDVSNFAIQSVAKDPLMPPDHYFSMPLAYPQIINNNLALDLANSFLFVVSPHKNINADESILAYHYSSDRLPHYCKEICFSYDSSGKIIVNRKFLKKQNNFVDNAVISNSLEGQAPYVIGKSLYSLFIDMVIENGLTIDNVCKFFNIYVESIREIGKLKIGDIKNLDLKTKFSGELFDATPENIILDRDGVFHFIDREWSLNESVELGYIIFRAIISLSNIATWLEFPQDSYEDVNISTFTCKVFAGLGWKFSVSDFKNYSDTEARIQSVVTGLPTECFAGLGCAAMFHKKPVRQRLDAIDHLVTDYNKKIDEVSSWGQSLSEQVSAQDSRISELTSVVSQRDAQIKNYNKQIEEVSSWGQSLSEQVSAQDSRISELTSVVSQREQEIAKLLHDIVKIHNEYKSSSSWRITAPLRYVSRLSVECYKALYQRGGVILRSMLSPQTVEKIKRLLPDPSGVPRRLMYHSIPITGTDNTISDTAASTDKPDVFVFSIIDWNFRTQRPQHIARLIAENHRVFYVEMMLEPDGPSVRRISERLFVVRLGRHSSGHIQPYVGCPDETQIQSWVASFIGFSEQVESTSFKHIIIQHPFWWQMAQYLPPEYRITFDCMDDIAGFSNTTERMLEHERNMIDGCDQIIVSSDYLKEKFSAIKRPTLIRNGADLDHFLHNEVNAEPPDIILARGFNKKNSTIKVGYVGAIADWFDVDLLQYLAQRNPDMEFHLCGGVTTKEAVRLEHISNVTLYGEIPYKDVPSFIRHMDVMTIPFRLLPIIQACDPVKFYEYSAMGKPTVSTCLPELNRAKSLAFLSTGPEEFSANLRHAVEKGNSVEFREALRDYAASNTWRHRSDLFEKAFQDLPKVSVIILSYGDAMWTIAALHSLCHNGPVYPNIEVIVVDNGSPYEQLIQIRRAVENMPIAEIHLIENGENLGFARGNNIGIKQATGDYVLLLNNDTYVAPGSIAAMVNHLRENPSIGVVGPMTNNIGNEARVEIHYANMDEMISKARQLTIGRRGRYSEMRVVAYFAAMFRRKDFDEFGLISEDYGLGMFEDDDHCAVIKSKGYICALAEDAFIHHHLSATFDTLGAKRKRKIFEENKAIYEAKWGDWVPHRYKDP